NGTKGAIVDREYPNQEINPSSAAILTGHDREITCLWILAELGIVLSSSEQSLVLQHTLNGDQKKQYVLLPGGAGFIGSHCVIELITVGYTPIVVDNECNSSAECLKRVEQITGCQIIDYKIDSLDLENLRNIFKKYSIYATLNCATLKAVDESCMEEFNVKNFLFSSSATVYGTPKYLPLDEKHPCIGDAITNPYDTIIAQSEWNIILLRYFNPVGAHKTGLIGENPIGKPNNLMSYIAQVAVGRLPYVSIFGTDYDTPDGTSVRDYIHVVHVAIGHIAAMKQFEMNCGLKIYNLGTGKECSRRAGNLATVYADPTLAAQELGWTAQRNLDEMCERRKS
ncbi:unnamed protein product, partial [Rotaria sordida]